MTNIADAKINLEKWIEKNLIAKIPGLPKRAAATVVVKRILKNSDTALEEVQKIPALSFILASSGIIKDGMIDEDVLVEFRQEMGTGTVDFSIPFIGEFSLDGDAVDSLYEALKKIGEKNGNGK